MSFALFRRIFLSRYSRPSPTSFRSLSTSPPSSPRPSTFLRTLSLATFLTVTSYSVGAFYPLPHISLIAPRPAPPPPEANSPEALVHTAELESALSTLPLLADLRSAPDAEEWYETRPYQRFPEERRVNNLTAGALRGPGRLAIAPLARARKDETESIVIVHVGRGVCGHDGIVHGGLLATLLDETLARTAINNLPDRVGVTANLSLNYRAPTNADQFIVIRTKLTETKGRKAVVSGRIEDLQGTLLVEATATFVQPRYAKLLNTTALKQAMGEPEPRNKEAPVHLADGVDLTAKRKTS